MTAAAMPPAVAARLQTLAQQAELASVRVSGVLALDAQLYPATSGGAVLQMQLRPARGLPYLARVDLGNDPTTRQLAEAELAHLHAGVLVSVAGDGFEVRQDHGHAVLRIVRARHAVSFHDPINPTRLTTAQEGNHVD